MKPQIDNKPRNYILIYPVYNLKISKDIGGEIRIERVLFISKEKIPRVRKRLGFRQKISEMKKPWTGHYTPKIFEEAPSFAIIKFKALPKEPEVEPINKIKDAIWILASSQFHTQRYKIRHFGLSKRQANIIAIYTLYDKKIKSGIRAFKQVSPVEPYELDKNWKRYNKNHFFFYLLGILNKKTNVSINYKWRKSIRDAAILAGKSHFSKDLPQAFLYNFIAIDNLLSIPGEGYPNCLIERLNGLFGWLTKERPEAWESSLKRLYKLRCDMVHKGDTTDIRTEDLINSDGILYNLLYNICRFIKVFPNRQSLVTLSKKVEARRILNQKVKERPNLQYSHLSTSRIMISKIKNENDWP